MHRPATLDQWQPVLDQYALIWAPVVRLPEVVDDQQVRETGYLQTVDHPHGAASVSCVPFKLSGTDVRPRGPAPEIGQNTQEVLLEMGYDWEQLRALRESGALVIPDL